MVKLKKAPRHLFTKHGANRLPAQNLKLLVSKYSVVTVGNLYTYHPTIVRVVGCPSNLDYVATMITTAAARLHLAFHYCYQPGGRHR